jgi:hypothetical protein
MKRLAALETLTKVRFAAAQATFARHMRAEVKLRDNLAQLIKHRMTVFEPKPQGDAASIAQAEISWHKWVDQRRTIVNTELAQVVAERLESQRKLRRAFGKDQAVAALIKEQKKAASRQRY